MRLSFGGTFRNNLSYIALLTGNFELARDTAELALEEAPESRGWPPAGRSREPLHLADQNPSHQDDHANRPGFLAEALEISLQLGLEDVMRHSVDGTLGCRSLCGASARLPRCCSAEKPKSRGRTALGEHAYSQSSRQPGEAMGLEEAADQALRWIGRRRQRGG